MKRSGTSWTANFTPIPRYPAATAANRLRVPKLILFTSNFRIGLIGRTAQGAVVPIYKLIQRGVFPPELVTMMGEVFEDLVKTLELTDHNDAATQFVAHKVVELVQGGERDPVR